MNDELLAALSELPAPRLEESVSERILAAARAELRAGGADRPLLRAGLASAEALLAPALSLATVAWTLGVALGR